MALSITATGTASLISASERPVAHRDTVEERYDFESLVYEDEIKSNMGFFPELDQVIGIMSVAYGKPANACLVRLSRMCDIMLNRTRATHERSYTP